MASSKSKAETGPRRLSPKAVRRIVIGLVAAALVAVALRVVLGVIAPVAPSGSAWQIQLSFQLDAKQPGALVSLAPPQDSPVARLYSQQLGLDGLRLLREKTSDANARRINAVTRRAGPVTLGADFVVRLIPRIKPPRLGVSRLTPAERERYLGADKAIDPEAPIVVSTLARLQQQAQSSRHTKPVSGPDNADHSADHAAADPVERIFDYVKHTISFNAASGATTAEATLKTGIGNDLGRARAMIALCRAARIPARLVTGFVLESSRPAKPAHWVEIHRKKRWQAYDPEYGFKQQLPDHYVAFSRGEPLLKNDNARLVAAHYDVREQSIPAAAAGDAAANPAAILNLSRLPLAMRTTLATLMLLPLCALLNAVVRTMVGVETYGTFSPAMLALAAVYVNWLTATVIFAVVAVISIFGRSMLPGLKLKRSPRLTIVFTLVALAMALAVSIMAFFDLQTGAQVILLPIVILTTLVDRIYAVADADGLRAALLRLLWTAITAVGCFVLLINLWLGEWLLRYPELQLITIALVIWLARYSGPTWLDRPALRWLRASEK